MNKYILGPELIWLILYGLAKFIANSNKAPDYVSDKYIDQCWFTVPVIMFLTFGLFWISGIGKNWLLLRIWIMGLVFSHLILNNLINSYSIQGPGIGMGYLAGMLFGFMALVVGSIVVKIFNKTFIA